MRMTVAESRQRFRDAPVARLGTVSASGLPHLVPVTFMLIDTSSGQGTRAAVGTDEADLIVFAVDHKPKSTTSLRRLDNIAGNPRVAFLADHYDDDWDQLWWVRADAVAAVLDGKDRLRAIGALRSRYSQYDHHPPQGVVVGASVVRWSGWRAAAPGVEPAQGRAGSVEPS